MTLRITCTDLETGESDTVEISHDNYLIVCGANRYVSHEQAHANGTSVITIKREPGVRRDAEELGMYE